MTASLLTLRTATDNDCFVILRWRNDPQTRTMSRNQDIIDPSVHEQWYQRVLNNPQQLLLIGELSNQSIGMVRFDSRESNRWEVSIMLAPEYRHKGLSKSLLQLAIHHLNMTTLEISSTPQKLGGIELIAQIKCDNVASKKLFEGIGFKTISQEAGLHRYAYQTKAQYTGSE